MGRPSSPALTATSVDPLRESARNVLIRLHLAEHNQSEALREFDRYRRLLRSELDLDPDAGAVCAARGGRARHAAVMAGPHAARMPSASSGLLVIRAWLEAGSSSPLRAEVRLTTDVSRGIEETLKLTDADSITAAVSVWLHQMAV